ncbi:MAG TPA: iron-containing alcohol dehydrogenase [Chthoniobacterales bacterium]|nr:iron-containing alcohol dehydrogenase [Chthoniobacterales bacterium]
MRFEFATSARIIFGQGALQRVGELLDDFGSRLLVVGGKDASRSRPLTEQLDKLGIELIEFRVAGEPTVDLIDRGVRLARSSDITGVIGFGGGSVIDSAKAIAGLTMNRGQITDYLEVIGKPQPLKTPALPLCAVPTTAGTGAEVTKNAVLGSPEHRVKVSLRGPTLLPRVVLIDPETTVPLPPAVTASTGLDTLTQLIEPYVSTRANPITDGFCLSGIPRVARGLFRAFSDGHDRSARGDMSLASLFGGMALANAGLGAVHGFAAPIGGMFDAPHGAVCAALLPSVMEMNIQALRRRMPDSEALRRYDALGPLLSTRATAKADDAVKWVRDLCRMLNVPRLGAFGIRSDQVSTLVEEAQRANSMKANPISLEPDELAEILRAAL